MRGKIPKAASTECIPFPTVLPTPAGEIHFSIDDESRTIFTRALGTISCPDFLNHINAKAGAGVLGYAELFDARDIALDFSGIELPLLAGEVRRLMGDERPASVAVVTNDPVIGILIRKYAETIREDHRSFGIFAELADARRWLRTADRGDD